MGSSTSKEVYYLPTFEEDQLPSLEKKTIAITGTTSGTGLVCAKVCVRKGAEHVLLLNRPSERAIKAEEEIKAEMKDGQNTIVETIPCDLQDFASVQNAAQQIKDKCTSLDVLVNNAGIMAMDDTVTKDGYDIQMQTNHLSHFLLTKELFPLLKKAATANNGHSRIVNHSSMARKGGPLDAARYLGKQQHNTEDGEESGLLGGNGLAAKWERYHQSKLANAVFTVALADRINSSTNNRNIKAVCAAPGYAITNLQTTSQGMGGMLWTRFFGQSQEDGTMPLLQACFGPSTDNGDFWEPSLRFNTIGPAQKVDLSVESTTDTNQTSRDALWKASEEACGQFSLSE